MQNQHIMECVHAYLQSMLDERVAVWLDFIDTAPPDSVRNEVESLRESGQVSASFIEDLERLTDLRGRQESSG